MYANQLNVIFKLDTVTRKFFKSVCPCDKIDKNMGTGKNFQIVNTRDSTHTGQHWLLFFKSKNTAYCFDSLANELKSYGSCVENAFKHFSTECSRHVMSRKKLQASNTHLCGIYCILAARELCNGKTINIIEKQFSNNLQDNDRKIELWFKKYLKRLLPISTCYRQGQFCTCETKWKK